MIAINGLLLVLRAQLSGNDAQVRFRQRFPGAPEHGEKNSAGLENLQGHIVHSDRKVVRFTELQFLAVLQHRSEEHTSELQSQSNLVCRLLLEKKNNHCTS